MKSGFWDALPRENTLHPGSGCGLQPQLFADGSLIRVANHLGLQFSITEQEKGWDAGYPVPDREISRFVDIYFCNQKFGMLRFDLLENRGEHLAWRAPCGPKVDKDRFI